MKDIEIIEEIFDNGDIKVSVENNTTGEKITSHVFNKQSYVNPTSMSDMYAFIENIAQAFKLHTGRGVNAHTVVLYNCDRTLVMCTDRYAYVFKTPSETDKAYSKPTLLVKDIVLTIHKFKNSKRTSKKHMFLSLTDK